MASNVYQPRDPQLPFGKRGWPALTVPCDPESAARWAQTLPGAKVVQGRGLGVGLDMVPSLLGAGVPLPDFGAMATGVQLPGREWFVQRFLPHARPHQPSMVEFLALRSYAINADPMRCLSGDTEVLINRGGAGRRYKLRDVVARFNGGMIAKDQRKWRRDILTMAQSRHPDGYIRLNEVIAAHAVGAKSLFLLKAGDLAIKATAEHVFFFPDGRERRLSELRTGDQVLRIEYPQQGVRPVKKRKTYLDQNAMWNHPFACLFTSGRGERVARVPKHRIAKEAELNGLDFDTFVATIRAGDVTGLRFLDPKVYAVHHLNEDTHDNRPENLEVVKHDEHWREHGRDGGWKHVTARAVPVTIESITPAGVEECFDLTLAGPHHNYVANGFVVHNSGKTLTTIAAAQLIGAQKILVVCPAIVKLNWAREIAKWTGESALILDGRAGTEARAYCVTCGGSRLVAGPSGPTRCHDCKARNGSSYGYRLHVGEAEAPAAVAAYRWIICNYDLVVPQTEYDAAGKRYVRSDLRGWGAILTEANFDLGILDEAHLLRGRTERARRSLSRRDQLQIVLKRAARVWGLTGTPIYGLTRDLYGLLDVLNPFGFGSGHEFDLRYAGAIHNGYGWEARGQTNVEELRSRLSVFMLKRDRAEIAPGMAPKHRHVTRIEATADELRAPPPEKGQKVGGIHAALRVTARIKERYAVEAACNVAAESERAIIFVYLRESMARVTELLQEKSAPKGKGRDQRLGANFKLWSVDGSLSHTVRDAYATAFREHTGPGVLVATMDSMPMGISLAGAASVLFADLHVEPATLLQAEDRALVHGVGGLDVEYFVVADSVDEHVVSIVLPKMEQIEVAMGDDEAGAFRAAFTPEVVADEVWARMAAAADAAG